jgi:hypothetical protein
MSVSMSHGGAEAGTGRLGGAEGDIGAAGDVEQRERRVALRRIEIGIKMSFQAVQADRHQIVISHSERPRCETTRHQRLLLAQGRPRPKWLSVRLSVNAIYPATIAPAAMALSRHLKGE